nr:translation initiation factor IF-3-like [Hydra vulgaris]
MTFLRKDFLSVFGLVYPLKKLSVLSYLQCTIRLIDETGKSTLVLKNEAEKIANERKMDLKQVGFVSEKLSHAVYKLVPDVPKSISPSTQTQHSFNNVKIKELTMTCLIEDHDLKVKSKKLQEFLDKGYHVTVTVAKPVKANLLPKTIFDKLILFLNCSVECSSTKVNENMYKSTVAKSEKNF